MTAAAEATAAVAERAKAARRKAATARDDGKEDAGVVEVFSFGVGSGPQVAAATALWFTLSVLYSVVDITVSA